MGQEKRFRVRALGKTRWVWFDTEIRLLRFHGCHWQSVPEQWNTGCYRFTHGGPLYQKACRRIWEWERSG